MKKCFKCGVVKALHDFYTHKTMKDGHLNKCKECAKTDVKKHRRENDSVREYDNRRSKEPHRLEMMRFISKRWREENPDGYRAHTAVGNAIRDGRLVRMPCEVCGNKRSHAHHEDYAKPFDVTWLCALHHHRLHAERNENDQTGNP